MQSLVRRMQALNRPNWNVLQCLFSVDSAGLVPLVQGVSRRVTKSIAHFGHVGRQLRHIHDGAAYFHMTAVLAIR